MESIFDGGRREARFFAVLASALVLMRTAPFLVYGYIDFDSDQAIMGLMAKHLSEFRSFPLFYYGQNYMLGAQAWVIAPLFWIARTSIAVQKIPMTIINVVAAILLVRLISSNLRLRPAVGFVAALPFILPTPIVGATFLQGVEPLLYVLLLWMLRARPLAFGALLAFGFLHREFTIYAIPALIVVQAADRSPWTFATARWIGWAAVGFAAVWLVIDDVRLHLSGVSLVLQAEMMGRHACFDAGQLVGRSWYILVTALPVLFGGRTMPLDGFGLRNAAVVGSSLIEWIVCGALLLMLFRLAWLWRWRSTEPSTAFGVYLALVGCCALGGYLFACGLAFDANPVVRYLNLGLLLPIGCFGVFMAREPSRRLRTAAAVVFVLWGAANAVDNLKVVREAHVNPQPNPHGALTEFLLAHQIRYARASYWDSYIVDFLSRERVIVASTGPVRIPEYQSRVDEHNDAAVNIERMPCEGQMHVAVWCIQLPANRPGEGAR